VKRIFPIIIILISLSLLGIIIIQRSWVINMIELGEKQVRQKVDDATRMVGQDFEQYKSGYGVGNRALPDLMPDNFSLELLRPSTVGQRFTVAEIEEKLRRAFIANNLKDLKFEFGLGPVSSSFNFRSFERKSRNFDKEYIDTANNIQSTFFIVPSSGSAAENLTSNEALTVIVPNFKKLVLQSLRWDFAIAILFTLIIIAAFYLTLRTLLRQKKLSEIKNDFINNMTHEFKTPIATISLAVDALKNEKVMFDKEKMGYFSNIIKEENKRMNRQVETILKASLLDRQEVELVLKPLHVHAVINSVLENFTLQLEERRGKADVSLLAENDLIEADEVHFSNLVNNLIDNAVKYGKDNIPPLIKITTASTRKNFILRIEDNGIGMNRDTVKRIFEKFYRAHTGNVHNVKGFGLGLSYVKTMVDAHHGEVKVDSMIGRGSTFTIELPLKKS
jgi:two-component system, OmpR family, phosphate regulon sensor histidine kinase PhoR